MHGMFLLVLCRFRVYLCKHCPLLQTGCKQVLHSRPAQGLLLLVVVVLLQCCAAFRQRCLLAV
jgi:hypothetical protein